MNQEMNPEVKALWIKALTSGEYEQGRGYLREADKYCCLGVLCELAVKAGKVRAGRVCSRYEGQDTIYEYGFDEHSGVLPSEVVAWAGLPAADPVPYFNDVTEEPLKSLSGYNDDGATFEEIARVIEEGL